jgi:hypothetical protein
VRTISELSETARGSLAAKRIFFGHQSVGGNIMDGVADLVRDQPSLGIRIVDLDGARTATGGFFAHAAVGRNLYPGLKTDDFAKLMDQGLASRLDIAFHKYCYVDVLEGTDIEAVFANYRDTMARLRATYPSVTFVHVTVPLTVVQSGPRALLKNLLGRVPNGLADNLRRSEFNELMHRQYSGREPIFDLAALESTTQSGETATIALNGRSGRTLVTSYTDDGGHLNRVARRRIAEALCVMLAQLPAAK